MHRIRGAALGLTLAAVLAACFQDDNSDPVGPRPAPAGGAMFQNFVALGNSITAGYQSSGISNTTQQQSFARLLAAQMGTAYAYPALAGRGCAPPVVNFQTQARAGTGSTSTTCDLLVSPAPEVINNVAVPGAAVADLTAEAGTSASNALTSLFLGGMTQVEKALLADPTFASIWIGNNDVLPAAVSGVLAPMAGVSPGVTSQATFESEYNEATAALLAAEPALEGILIGVVKVSNAPLFFPVGALLTSPAALAGFDQAAGYKTGGDPVKASPMVIDANCNTAPTTLISFRIASEIARFRNDTNPTGQAPKAPASRAGHPAYISCGVSSTPGAPPAPVGELFILTTAEQTTLTDAVNAYNAYISAKANTLGWAYLNPNQALDSLRTAGQIPTFPNLASATATFGAWISLDGAHPSAQAHRLITNYVIDAINAKYGTTLAKISVP